MREQYDLAAFVGYFGDGRRHALEPGGVGDAAIFRGHVEIDAQQYALALHVDVVEGAECLGHFELSGAASTTLHHFRDTIAIAISPSRRPCPPSGWRSPIHCRTTTSPAPTCRSALWSDPCGKWT